MAESNTQNTANHLINEKSPYLKQHADNPVDWYPWGEEAFRLAKALDKPIFLSIGYSTCHWCHVMERESFEDPRVAEILNDTFVCIKVDREERPDIDSIYMHFCQATTGSGGWPLNVILTPERKPLFAMTYMPRTTRRGMMGVTEMAESVKELWKEQRNELIERSDNLVKQLKEMADSSTKETDLSRISDSAFNNFRENYDAKNGGFGSSPKFPSPHNIVFLLRYYRKTGNMDALAMAQKTLIRMRLGGIFDHVGGGFHRYSTDPFWTVPHFEKMLYDQAMLIWAYSETYTVTGNEFYRNVAYEIIDFLNREMKDELGPYHTALDADSEGIEGKYYLWRKEELLRILGENEEEFSELYGVERDGNFTISDSNMSPGQNILHLSSLSDEDALKMPWITDEITRQLENLRKVRDKRIHPGKDNKILTDLNSLLAFSLIRAAGSFNDRKLLKSAIQILDFIDNNMNGNGGILMHSYLDGTSEVEGFLDDYAFLSAALIEAFQATGDDTYLKRASELQKHLELHFMDEKGGYYLAGDYELSNILRMKPDSDGAVPNGNSFQMLNLVNLSQILENQNYLDIADKIPMTLSDSLKSVPRFHSLLITGIDHQKKHYAVRSRMKKSDVFKHYVNLLASNRPETILIPIVTDAKHEVDEIKELNSDKVLSTGVYQMCSGTECLMPVKTLKEALNAITD